MGNAFAMRRRFLYDRERLFQSHKKTPQDAHPPAVSEEVRFNQHFLRMVFSGTGTSGCADVSAKAYREPITSVCARRVSGACDSAVPGNTSGSNPLFPCRQSGSDSDGSEGSAEQQHYPDADFTAHPDERLSISYRAPKAAPIVFPENQKNLRRSIHKHKKMRYTNILSDCGSCQSASAMRSST